MAVLVDSSLWIHQLRRSGDVAKRERVHQLLIAGEAAWCPPVRLELWRGVTSDAERTVLRRYESVLPDYLVTNETWSSAIRLADRGRAAGLTFPMADLLIFSCAREHGLELAHDDEHFVQLARLSE